MQKEFHSRFITFPSVVDKSSNETVAVVDATEHEVEQLGLFCKTSQQDYDIYLYRKENDKKWLDSFSQNVDKWLINQSSDVIIDNSNQVRFTSEKDLLEYFFDKETK